MTTMMAGNDLSLQTGLISSNSTTRVEVGRGKELLKDIALLVTIDGKLQFSSLCFLP
jgi:hypothetical protein